MATMARKPVAVLGWNKGPFVSAAGNGCLTRGVQEGCSGALDRAEDMAAGAGPIGICIDVGGADEQNTVCSTLCWDNVAVWITRSSGPGGCHIDYA